MIIDKVHCLFEQSGIFKDCFKKLGYKAFDYDIENNFNKTDYIVDLFHEIHKAYNHRESIFDSISSKDLIIAFFPCIRFSKQAIFLFKCTNFGFKYFTNFDKVNHSIQYMKDLYTYFVALNQLVAICFERNLRIIIENPYDAQSFLIRYWFLEPTLIDYDRTKSGDYFVKPTMYYFINCEPCCYFDFSGVDIKSKKNITKCGSGINRSLISSDYALRFIKSYILGGDIHENYNKATC